MRQPRPGSGRSPGDTAFAGFNFTMAMDARGAAPENPARSSRFPGGDGSEECSMSVFVPGWNDGGGSSEFRARLIWAAVIGSRKGTGKKDEVSGRRRECLVPFPMILVLHPRFRNRGSI